MIGQKQKAIVALLLSFAVAAPGSPEVWQHFSSSRHFSVTFPTDWFRFGVSTDRLQIRSSKGGAEAVLIKRDQAEITVVEAEGSSTKTLTQVIDYYTKGTSILSRTTVSNESSKQGCGKIEEVISKESVIPPGDALVSVPYIINTELFCEIDGHKIVTVLRNWEDDSRQEDYQNVALQMARSIRLARGKPGPRV
ncbi:MAG TPA: hypothetical protein VKP61_05420 [Candidatus Acidoferrum sp.]|nr:hypothetical protein [Candidatus Acidoferrum sp.]